MRIHLFTIAAALVLLTVAVPAHASASADSGNDFYQSCMAAADLMEGRQPSDDLLQKAPMCFGAVTAISSLEPFLKPQFAMCPPKEGQITYAQIVLVIADYLKKHPEQLHENFHMIAVLAFKTAWPCPTASK